MQTPPLTIYRSSAGSGKTYTLTREYLRLALSRPGRHGYRRILAVTFTNKAMQEMKNRIVWQLDEFSKGRRNSMADELCSSLGLSGEEFTARTAQLLAGILHDYGHFSITTIDAFFQRVIRGFARELGVAGTYRLELQPDMTLTEVVHELLIRVQNDPMLLGWIRDYSLSRLDEGKGWDIEANLYDYATELIKEDFQAVEPEILHKKREQVIELHKSLQEIIYKFEAHMKEAARDGVRIMDHFGVVPKDFSYGAGGAGGYLNKILNGECDPKTRITNQISNETYLTGKWSETHDQVNIALDHGLRDVFQACLAYWQENHEVYLTAVEVVKRIYVFGISLDILDHLNQYKKDHDLMFISDATRFLTELVTDTDAPFIYEKIGSYYDHFLIDEFQDTSLFQWKSFRPLLENSLAEGKANLIVGDVKQSIYRWRGGDLELLQNGIEKEIGAAYIANESLRNNYRSQPSVIRFNNAVFERFATRLADAYALKLSGVEDAGKLIEEVYQDVSQAIRPDLEKGEGGYVEVSFYSDSSEKDGAEDSWRDQVDMKIPALIEKLQDRGVPLKKIAILVRDNKDGSRIASLLQEYDRQHPVSCYHYDVVSNDSLFLSGSPALQVIIAALRFIQDPADRINRASLLYHYRILNGLSVEGSQNPFLAIISTKEFFALLPEKFAARPEEWANLPFLVLIERLIHAFGLSALRHEFAYLQTFQDHVLQFVSRDKGDLTGFLEWWEIYSGRESIKVPDDLDAIRIMTIHKSKGLEFHSVIMPYVDWSADHKYGPVMWLSSSQAPYAGGRVPVTYSSGLADTFFSGEYQKERLKAYVDNMNLLYVGFTRAIHDLWIFARSASKEKRTERDGAVRMGEVLQKTLSVSTFPYGSGWNGQQLTFTLGEKDFTYHSLREEQQTEPVRLTEFSENHWPDKLQLKPNAVRLVKKDRQLKIDTGRLIHRMLAMVHHVSDLEKVVAEVSWEEGLRTGEVAALMAHIREAFNRPLIADWFDTRWHVRTEASILTPENIYRPDRVMTDGREWVVIDYKTGVAGARDRNQVKNYMDLVAAMEPLPVRGFIWYIDLNEVIEL